MTMAIIQKSCILATCKTEKRGGDNTKKEICILPYSGGYAEKCQQNPNRQKEVDLYQSM